MVPYLAAYPWIQAAVDGVLIGTLGAAIFISISSLLHAIAEQRRSRRALARCAESNDRVLQDLLAHPQSPAPAAAAAPAAPAFDTAVSRARFAFWNSKGLLSGSLWAARSHEVRPKAN